LTYKLEKSLVDDQVLNLAYSVI